MDSDSTDTQTVTLLPRSPTGTTGNPESNIWGWDRWLRAKQGYWFVPGLYLVFFNTSYLMFVFIYMLPWKPPSCTLKLLFPNSQRSAKVCTKYYGSILKILPRVCCKALTQSNKLWCLESKEIPLFGLPALHAFDLLTGFLAFPSLFCSHWHGWRTAERKTSY